MDEWILKSSLIVWDELKDCYLLRNINFSKGCQKGPHSNVKPEEPESITGKKDNRDLNEQLKDFGEGEVKQNQPLTAARLSRPCFEETPLVRVVPTKAATLKTPTPASDTNGSSSNGRSGEIQEGESCKNGGCKVVS